MVVLANAFCVFHFRYCDCFANGEFCNNCNCTNCYNNLDHENDRQKAIKVRSLFSTFKAVEVKSMFHSYIEFSMFLSGIVMGKLSI